MNVQRWAISCLLVVAYTSFIATTSLAQDYVRDSRPELFSYPELVQLGSADPLSPELTEKLHALTTIPFINNEAYFRGAKPRPLIVEKLGPTLRVAFWNIERGLELDDITLLLTDTNRFISKAAEERKHAQETGRRIRTVNIDNLRREIETLKAADVWVLNEVDWGVKRTEYREVVREIATTLDMNWAFGVEFLEVDSKQLGTDTFDDGETEREREQLVDVFRVEKDRLRALHGNAVLSRYPIRAARLIPFTDGYDWFKESKIRPLEGAKRKAAILIGEDLLREVRRGQRTALYVDLDVPDVPGHQVTVVSTHLENRAKPVVRRKQFEEVLAHIRDISNPVIVIGDFNTTGSDANPTSAEYMLYKRFSSADYWATNGVQWATGVGAVYSATRTTLKLSGIQYRIDPTSQNIPGLSPNLERGLFTTIERFRFADGSAFDLRGDPARTANGKGGTLANSNQRGQNGFTPTFDAVLIWKKVRVAKFKLDWILVKSDLKNPRDVKAPYRFSPHFGRTLTDVNHCLPEPISDHSPMTVDLPFNEPTLLDATAPSR